MFLKLLSDCYFPLFSTFQYQPQQTEKYPGRVDAVVTLEEPSSSAQRAEPLAGWIWTACQFRRISKLQLFEKYLFAQRCQFIHALLLQSKTEKKSLTLQNIMNIPVIYVAYQLLCFCVLA